MYIQLRQLYARVYGNNYFIFEPNTFNMICLWTLTIFKKSSKDLIEICQELRNASKLNKNVEGYVVVTLKSKIGNMNDVRLLQLLF